MTLYWSASADGSGGLKKTDTSSHSGIEKNAPQTDQDAPRAIRWNGLVALVNHPTHPWMWVVTRQKNRDVICLQSPRGKIWRFRLHRGAHITPV